MNAAIDRGIVLVIDDQRFQRRTLARMLEGSGCTTCSKPPTAPARSHCCAPTATSLLLVVSDVDMPEMDGLEFLRCLADEAPHTAVAIHSALDRALLKSVEAMAAEYGLRLVGVLEKPASEPVLRAVLESARHTRALPTHALTAFDAMQMRAGLENGEFEPWFQPKIDLETGRACGAEALVRWRQPRGETFGPDRFLDVIRAAGLMRALTLQVAARSAQSLEQLPRRGQGFTVALNVCPTLLDDPGFGEALAHTLLDAGASPEEVILEVTESATARNQGAALENLARLRMRGFELSIDDFGTGFSSLSQLVRTPFSELKIDRSFVSRIEVEGADRMLVDSTVALAHRLGLRTVAEGVERDAQLEILQRFGCDMAQGYLFAKPMPMLEWQHWMEAREYPAAPPAGGKAIAI